MRGNVAGKGFVRRGIGSPDLGNLVVDFSHTLGESLGVPMPADVHGVDLGFFEEEVIMKGSDFETCIEGGRSWPD